MGVLEDIKNGVDEGKRIAADILDGESKKFSLAERHMFDDSMENPSRLAIADNLVYMKTLIDEGYTEKFSLIYIDPPFFTGTKYDATLTLVDKDDKCHRIKHLAYDDTFERDLEYYTANMTSRLILMRELLSHTGLIWVHLDWHSAHCIKLVMDELFGEKNFVNEIIWKYKSGGSGKNHFSRKHDTILLYSKSADYSLDIPKEKSYNRELKAYRFSGIKEYKDKYGWYTLVNMKDVWAIDMLGRTSSERTGYATQKPMELMSRIIESSTKEGDLVGDFFCGSGSFLEAAERIGRTWIGCDNVELALGTAKRRLDSCQANYCYYRLPDEKLYNDGVSFEETAREELENGKNLYTYSLTKFMAEPDIGHISLKDRKKVTAMLADDPSQFVDYIMVDTDYNGSFNAEMMITENFDCIRFISNGNMAFIAVDIFGKEYFFEDKRQLF